MNASLSSVLAGAVAMASFVAMLFFLKYWRRTRDSFFLFFALAFGIDSASRFVVGFASISDESEPLYYLPRLVSFCLIIAAIVIKNRPGGQNP
jgi:uncharacterized membrane protein HdeD (DUF308 family)